MNIAVIGTGYVGLVTGTCFAEAGNNVTCIDIDAKKVAAMQAGNIPIYEPGLEDLFTKNIEASRLSFTTDLTEAVVGAEVLFLALPTPPAEDGSADLSYILGVADDLGKIIKSYTVVVDKSTVPVGTAELVQQHIAEGGASLFDVASNPEFLREGFAVSDFMKPDRVVIGSSSEKAQKVLEELYKPFITKPEQLLMMDERSAEMTKYAANSFLATKISYMNEIANLCEKLGADVDAVRLGMGSDERIGHRFLYPGIGYGGSCFPKDVLALLRSANDNDYKLEILDAVNATNQKQKRVIVEKVLNQYEGNVAGKTFALWGLAFKPDTDDIREAPALEIIHELTKQGARIVAFDPEAMGNVKQVESDNKNLSFGKDKYTVLKDADGLIIATEWPDFHKPDFDKMAKLLKEPVIFDGRNLYTKDQVEGLGFYYESIGREVVYG